MKLCRVCRSTSVTVLSSGPQKLAIYYLQYYNVGMEIVSKSYSSVWFGTFCSLLYALLSEAVYGSFFCCLLNLVADDLGRCNDSSVIEEEGL